MSPSIATAYSGMAWPDMTVSGTEPTHVFAIGDWGGLDGTLWTHQWPPNGRARLIAYKGGAEPGPAGVPDVVVAAVDEPLRVEDVPGFPGRVAGQHRVGAGFFWRAGATKQKNRYQRDAKMLYFQGITLTFFSPEWH